MERDSKFVAFAEEVTETFLNDFICLAIKVTKLMCGRDYIMFKLPNISVKPV